jgi:hypothetical protein
VSVHDAHWLVTGDGDDEGASWTAAPLQEPVMTMVTGEELIVAGRADDAIAQILVSLNRRTRAAHAAGRGALAHAHQQ